MQITAKCNSFRTVFEYSVRILNFEIIYLVNSDMWIRMAVKLPHNFAVCQKTLGNSSRDLYAGGGRKTPAFCIRTAINHRLNPVNVENPLRPHEKQYHPNKRAGEIPELAKEWLYWYLLNYLPPNYLQSKQHTYQTHYWQTKTATCRNTSYLPT